MVAMNELSGFEVYKPGTKSRGSVIYKLSTSENKTRFSSAVVNYLGLPQFVNIFFDYSKKRMMVTAGAENNENILKLNRAGSGPSCAISCMALLDELEKLTGVKPPYCVLGKVADSKQPAVIFDLTQVTK